MDASRENVLHKTHYGLNIYSHILRLYYPACRTNDKGSSRDEVVLSLRGRDCLPTRNPFNQDRPTLHVLIRDNLAQHEDIEGKIPAGDCFDFAMFHYFKHGQDLLNTLNQEMHLRIGVKYPFYHGKMKTVIKHTETTVPQFSFYKAPIRNIFPERKMTLGEVYQLVRSDEYRARTETLRRIIDPKKARQFKAQQFDYVTFSGSFSKRNDQDLSFHSGLLTIDFDHIDNILELKRVLLNDEYFETELLFRSPSGDGLKWIIPIDVYKAPHQDYFKAVAHYLKVTYNLEVDPSGKDISRACFLPHDPEIFINPKYL